MGALLAISGCASEPADDNGLQALMHDDPVVAVTHGAISAPAGGTGGAPGVRPGGSGGAPANTGGGTGTIDAGSAGLGGRPAPDGGVSTGTGGIDTFPGGTGGVGGSSRMDGGVRPPVFGPLGQWSFDDCNSFRTNLSDSGPNGNTAFRSVSVACTTGISVGAVGLANKDDDIVYVPDQPTFTFDAGVTVAAWFNATSTNQTRTLFRKRDSEDNSSLALVLNGGKYQMVVKLTNGKLVSVTAPKKAKAGVWTHVAGTYDGTTLRLYVDGAEVDNRMSVGTIAPGAGPLLMGNDGSKRLFAGSIDEAFFDARGLSADEVLRLTCLRHDPTVVATPAVGAPTLPGTPATFDVAVTDNDSAACDPSSFNFQVNTFIQGLSIDPSFAFLGPVAPGETAHLAVNVTGSDDLDPGTFNIPFVVFGNNFSSAFFGSFDFVLAASGCRVSTARELMIKSLSVVDDPVRTTFTAPPGDARGGVWTFKNMAPTPEDAPAMVEAMLSTFGTTQTINGFNIDPRPGMQQLILNNWPRTAGGALDLTRAPLQLQAIVNRFDLRNLSEGNAGEGRFVFAFLSPGSPFPLQATMIFEYKLPATTEDDVLGWANAWHALGGLPFPSEDYNAALQAITDRFSGRGARPGATNGNAINAVRTNEIDFGNNGIWQLREFGLSPSTGRLVPATIKLTPDLSFNGSNTLAAFVNANEAAIIAETHTVPETFQGQPFLGGAVFNDLSTWSSPGINNNEARHHFALNTCNGCHSAAETGVFFLQISPRFPGSEAFLSGFLTGTTVFDQFSGQTRTFNDLGRRAADLRPIVCPGDQPPPTGTGGAGGGGGSSGTGGMIVSRGTGGSGGIPMGGPAPMRSSLARGISRVH
jgi:hypothetical protein